MTWSLSTNEWVDQHSFKIMLSKLNLQNNNVIVIAWNCCVLFPVYDNKSIDIQILKELNKMKLFMQSITTTPPRLWGESPYEVVAVAGRKNTKKLKMNRKILLSLVYLERQGREKAYYICQYRRSGKATKDSTVSDCRLHPAAMVARVLWLFKFVLLFTE